MTHPNPELVPTSSKVMAIAFFAGIMAMICLLIMGFVSLISYLHRQNVQTAVLEVLNSRAEAQQKAQTEAIDAAIADNMAKHNVFLCTPERPLKGQTVLKPLR